MEANPHKGSGHVKHNWGTTHAAGSSRVWKCGSHECTPRKLMLADALTNYGFKADGLKQCATTTLWTASQQRSLAEGRCETSWPVHSKRACMCEPGECPPSHGRDALAMGPTWSANRGRGQRLSDVVPRTRHLSTIGKITVHVETLQC